MVKHEKLSTGRINHIGTNKKHERVARKYVDTHKFFILEFCTEQDRSTREGFWIDLVWKTIGKKYSLNIANTPVLGNRTSKRLKSMWAVPGARKAQSIKFSGVLKEYFSNQKNRDTKSSQAKKQWEDPKFKSIISQSVKDWFKIPENTTNKASHTRRQWEDPKFQEINRQRLKKLYDSGWIPVKQNNLTITTPTGKTYCLRQRDFIGLFGFGCKVGGIHAIMSNCFYRTGTILLKYLNTV